VAHTVSMFGVLSLGGHPHNFVLSSDKQFVLSTGVEFLLYLRSNSWTAINIAVRVYRYVYCARGLGVGHTIMREERIYTIRSGYFRSTAIFDLVVL
jgi:hypothetical protein